MIKVEDIVESAVKAGSKGATIIHARGSGIHEQKPYLISQ